jgi:hypothetical protein
MKKFMLNFAAATFLSLALVSFASADLTLGEVPPDGLCPGVPGNCGPNNCPAGQPFCGQNLNKNNCTCHP